MNSSPGCNIWFTSDQHFGHANVIKYCNRPFASVEEMDAELIKRWNEVVKPQDLIYHLGDFTLGNDADRFLSRLNGFKKFVVPNFHHDQRWIERGVLMENYQHMEILPPIFVDRRSDIFIVLCHYPIAVWDRKHYGAWHLYGHVHERSFLMLGFCMNVGVDHHNFYPVSYDEVKQHMEGLGWHKDWKEERIE